MRGFAPTPAGISSLHPFSGNINSYHTDNVPVKQSNMHTYFCRERMCFSELGAPQLHAETPLQRKIVSLRVGCGTAAHGLAV